jgi:hypothetical protein
MTCTSRVLPLRRSEPVVATNPVHASIELRLQPGEMSFGSRLDSLPICSAELRGRAALVAENGLLRQQLIVAERKPLGRIRWAPWQRFTMGVTTRIAPAWRSATLLVRPATILRWHRAGFRVFWW